MTSYDPNETSEQLAARLVKIQQFVAEVNRVATGGDMDDLPITEALRARYHAVQSKADLTVVATATLVSHAELEREVVALHEALREERAKWGWETLLYVGRQMLEKLYPADIFTGASGDLGPAYIVALREVLRAIDDPKKTKL